MQHRLWLVLTSLVIDRSCGAEPFDLADADGDVDGDAELPFPLVLVSLSLVVVRRTLW